MVTIKGRPTSRNVLHCFYSVPKHDNPEQEKIRIIETAAKLIKSDIKCLSPQGATYPTAGDISTPEKCINFVPNSLHLLLKGLFVGKNTFAK